MIAPRANETAAVEEILNSDDYEDGRAMAKAIVKAVVAELEKRDAWVVGVGYPSEGPWLPVGPFWGKGEAAKFVTTAQSNGQVANYGLLVGGNHLYQEAPNLVQVCTCGHHKGIHTSSWGCCVMLNSKQKTKGGVKCPCSGFAELEGAA